MTEHADNGSSIHKRREGMCYGGRRSGVFCGLIFLSLGLVWLGNKTGLISLDMSLFWPSIMVLTGAWMLAAAALRRKKSSFPE